MEGFDLLANVYAASSFWYAALSLVVNILRTQGEIELLPATEYWQEKT
jgi:hypothetical protein